MINLQIGQKTEHGTIIGFDNNPKNKPVIIKLKKEKTSIRGKKYDVGYFYYDQI